METGVAVVLDEFGGEAAVGEPKVVGRTEGNTLDKVVALITSGVDSTTSSTVFAVSFRRFGCCCCGAFVVASFVVEAAAAICSLFGRRFVGLDSSPPS